MDAAIRAYRDVLAACLDQVVAPSGRRHLRMAPMGACSRAGIQSHESMIQGLVA